MQRFLNKEAVLKTINLKLDSKKSPKEILERDFDSLGHIPISGGWGYSLDDVVFINKYPDRLRQTNILTGYELQNEFIKNRIYEELIIRRKKNKFIKIRWKKLKQRLIPVKNGYIDHLEYRVCGLNLNEDILSRKKYFNDQKIIADELTETNYNQDSDEILICYETEFWFDISSFFGTDGRL